MSAVKLTLDGRPVGPGGHLELPHPGRHRLELIGGPLQVELDGVSLPIGERTRVPMFEGELIWRDSAGEGRVRLHPNASARPGAAPQEALEGFARRLDTLVGRGPLAFDRCEEIPLFFPDELWPHLASEPIDAQVRPALGPLYAIAGTPRSRLREEHVVLPVSRVRRLARDADRHLVRDGRDLMGGLAPAPLRLKARLLDDDLAIYENRVVVTLCRELQSRARKRLGALDLALAQLEWVTRELDRLWRYGLYKRHHVARKRAGLDGEAHDQLLTGAQNYRQELVHQLRAYRAVLEGPLGVSVRDADAVRGALEATNILAFDDRYGAVALLWRHWQRARKARRERDVYLDDLDGTYRRFVRLLIVQVLHALRFELVESTDATVRLDDASGPLRLARADGWRVDLTPTHRGSRLTYRLEEAAPAAPDRRKSTKKNGKPKAKDERRVIHEGVLDFVATFDNEERPQGTAGDGDTVWLHPVTQVHEDRDAYLARASSGVSPRRPGGDTPPPAAPAAPWNFATFDAVMRLLRARLLGASIGHDRVPDTCPVCMKPGQVDERPEDRRCSDEAGCGARWGRRKCSRCQAWIPKLLPKLPKVDLADDEAAVRQELMDTLVGADGLADLCLSVGGKAKSDMWMICPSCGHCGKDERAQATCSRCSDVCASSGQPRRDFGRKSSPGTPQS